MRAHVVLTLAVVASCSRGCATPAAEHPGDARTLDTVLAAARTANQPVIVEFGAPWCKPCRVFADTVLPRADVQAALATATFAYYDTGTPAGSAAADKLGVATLPAFVSVDATTGAVRDKRVGSAPTADGFIAFIRAATAR